MNRIKKQNYSNTKHILSIIGVISAIVSVVAAFMGDKFDINTGIILSAIILLITVFVVLVIEMHELKKFVIKSEYYYSSLFNTECIGGKEAAIGQILDSLEFSGDIEQIWNTHFSIDEEFDHKRIETNQFATLFRKVLSRGGCISDFYGGPDKGAVEHHEKLIESIGKTENYKVKRISLNAPIINFMIIQRKESQKKEVYFGWGGHSEDQIGKVFFSEDANLIDVFQKQHSLIGKYPTI